MTRARARPPREDGVRGSPSPSSAAADQHDEEPDPEEQRHERHDEHQQRADQVHADTVLQSGGR